MPEPKFRSFRVDAVVLRHSDYGEADRLLTLYTRQIGKTRALAKGARKIASRKAGHIEPFTHVKLQLAKGRDMLILTQADTVDAYQPLREDLILTSQASYVLELLDRFTYQDETENSAIFRLLTETLSRLASKADPWLVIRYYEMRLLDHLRVPPAALRMCQLQAPDPARGPILLLQRGRRDLPAVWAGIAQPQANFGGNAQVSASLSALELRGAARAQPGLDIQNEAEEPHAGIFHLFARA